MLILKKTKSELIIKLKMRLFHYTTIDTLAYMMSNRSIRFSRLDTLDDKTESEPFAAFNPLKYIFSCSFTDDPKESIPLWKMYANMETGIRLEFDSATMFSPSSVKTNIPSNTQERCDFQPYIYTAVKSEDIINEDYVLMYWDYPKVDSLCSCIKIKGITYYDDFSELYKSKIRIQDVALNNSRLTNRLINYDPLDFGFYKTKYWEFQKEVRLLIYAIPFAKDSAAISEILSTNKPIKTESILVPLSEIALDNLKIVLAPKSTEASKLIVEALTSKLSNVSIEYSALKNTLR